MKNLYLVFATIIGLMSFSQDASLAQVKQLPSSKIEPKVKPQQQTLGINNFSVNKLISGENDKSQPAQSLTQRYRIVYEAKDGKRQTMIIQLQLSKEREIFAASIVSAPKAMMGSTIVIGKEVTCDPPCRKQCKRILDFEHDLNILFCFCCCRPTGC